MQSWSSNLKRVLKEGWPLTCVPIILYSKPILNHIIGFYEAYALVCFLPGILSLIAFGLYKHDKISILPTIMSILCSLGFGSIFTYSVAMQTLIPILPHTLHEVLPFLENTEFKWIFIAISSPLVALLIIFHLIKFGMESSKKVKQEHAQGSARFATEQEIKALHNDSGLPVGCLIKGKLSTDIDVLKKEINTKASQEIVRLNPHHMVLVAPSGAGKGVGVIIPTLLDYDGPVLVTDVKAAENYHVTSRRRREMGREVFAFDPFNKTGNPSDSINILNFLDKNSKEIIDDAAMIAALFVPVPTNVSGNSKHFYDRARATIQSLILYVVCSEALEPHDKTLLTVYKLLCLSGEDFREMLSQIAEDEEIAYGQPARVAASLLSTAPEEISGILNTARNELGIFDSPLMQEVTSSTTIDLNKLILNQADLFLCIPIEKLKAYSRVIRLIVSMVFIIAQKNQTCLKKPLLMVLDEMALLGSIPAVEEALVSGRGYGVKILAVAQNLELVQKFSPDTWETFLASNLLVFIGPTGLKSSEYVSKLLGQSTIEAVSNNKGESQQKGQLRTSLTSENQGESQSFQGRPMLTSDEVRFLGDDTVIAFYKDLRPILLKKIKYYIHELWQRKFGNNPLEKHNLVN